VPTESADVVVIGAGIFGCAIAHFLAREGDVLDAVDIGAEASGANAATFISRFCRSVTPTRAPNG
jgi:glycine/D-amino acid oxidase-like deaminating enzyme